MIVYLCLHPGTDLNRFIGRHQTMRVFLFRPSPQVPKPSVRSAIICYDASAYLIKLQSKQVDSATVDITWIFLLALFMALNTILWSISYPEVRALHNKEELEEHIDIAIDVIAKCRERWPGTAAASNLYSKLAKACLRSYDSTPPSSLSANSPSSLTDNNSPSASEHSSATNGSLAHSQNAFSSPQFSYVFHQVPEQLPEFDYGTPPPPVYTGFRSNSIFENPPSGQSDRRFSYFPPDFVQPSALPNVWNPMPLPQEPDPAQNTMIADPTYFMQPMPYSFNNPLYTDPGYDINMRQGSLSQEQQVELMQNLETYGLTEIENIMNLSAQYENPIKPEQAYS
jgi:hypothetical protein